MQCSNHSKDRMKERLGLKNSTAEKLAQKAYIEGISHNEVSGRMHRYMTSVSLSHGKRTTVSVYGRFIYIFGVVQSLITVIPLPHDLEAIADKLTKRKRETKEVAEDFCKRHENCTYKEYSVQVAAGSCTSGCCVLD